MRFETRCVRVGLRDSEVTGSISVPIYQTATFRHPELGKSTGYDYSRTGNPTRSAVEAAIADLDDGGYGLAFSSGMAAISAVLHLFKSGDHLIVSDDLYGGTYRLFEEVYRNFGLTVDYVDTTDSGNITDALTGKTRAVFIETPSNPLMKVTDLSEVARLTKAEGLLLIVDNTFMTPYWQQPIRLGADIVVYSATKYLGGHNDLVAGLLVTADPSLEERLRFIQNSVGAVLGPQDSWLLLRGLKTLAVRLDRSQDNAVRIAHWLEQHPLVKRVYYPGLKTHPGHSVMGKNCSGWGAMISFEVSEEALVGRVLKELKMISFAESLGGVESLITYPAMQTHADVPRSIREALGINDRLLRLSVGIESEEDLIADLDQALR